MSPEKRREMDVTKLMMSDYKVEMINDSLDEFTVEFHGPKESLYEGGVWKIHVQLPNAYPYKSPSIGFINKIFHPNVDEESGTICLDVINELWSPMFDLINVFEVFLPQLLLYPNSSDPLNINAAFLMDEDDKRYELLVKGDASPSTLQEYIDEYAKKKDIIKREEPSEADGNQDSQGNDLKDDEIAGKAIHEKACGSNSQ